MQNIFSFRYFRDLLIGCFVEVLRLMMSDSIPPEVVEQLRRFNEALTILEDTYLKHFSNSLEENAQRPPLEKLEIDLMSVFVINSLYWMLLCTHGQKPKENEVLQNEIDRTKEYMGRLKQLEERKTAPCLNQRAAKSFVRNALWEPKQQQRSGTSNHSCEEDAGKGDEQCEMESGNDCSISLEEEAEIGEEQMEEDEIVFNSHLMKNAVKRSPREANIMMTGGTLPKKKRL
uniref:Nuclear nucleic acid-binding protein C1D n=3 Tax=Brugia TaxID=6278 RepID=A0A0H5SFR2_BRUMA|nr:Bm6734 [Brugia malayi]